MLYVLPVNFTPLPFASIEKVSSLSNPKRFLTLVKVQ